MANIVKNFKYMIIFGNLIYFIQKIVRINLVIEKMFH